MKHTKKRLSVTLDNTDLEEVMRLTGARTKREAIAKALQELVKSERRRALADALGTGVFETAEKELYQRRRRAHARD